MRYIDELRILTEGSHRRDAQWDQGEHEGCGKDSERAFKEAPMTPHTDGDLLKLADQIHDACPHKIDEPPNCALVKSRLECVCEHVHMHAIRAARSGNPVLSALVDLHAVARVDRDEDYAAITNAAAVIEAAGSGCVAQAAPDCGAEIDRLRAQVEYWRLAAERREARKERSGVDVAEASTLDADEACAADRGGEA